MKVSFNGQQGLVPANYFSKIKQPKEKDPDAKQQPSSNKLNSIIALELPFPQEKQDSLPSPKEQETGSVHLAPELLLKQIEELQQQLQDEKRARQQLAQELEVANTTIQIYRQRFGEL